LSHRSADAVSVTTVSTLVDESAVGNLVVISDNPRAEKVSVCRSHEGRDASRDSSGDDDDDDDLVTDYLTQLRVDADSATASLSPESGRQFGRMSRSSRSSASSSSSSRKTAEELDEEDDDAKLPEAAKARNPEEHQDTISDESGYSEDSSPSAKEEALEDRTREAAPDCPPPSPKLGDLLSAADDCDLSVKGVMISEFSTAERFRYLQRSRRNVQRARSDFLQNKVTEFCINI
jgi:hypothetical protein